MHYRSFLCSEGYTECEAYSECTWKLPTCRDIKAGEAEGIMVRYGERNGILPLSADVDPESLYKINTRVVAITYISPIPSEAQPSYYSARMLLAIVLIHIPIAQATN